MSKLAKLKGHLHTLDEISNIMTGMKNLALIEMNKMAKFIPMQKKVTETVKMMGSDFLNHHPALLANIQLDKPSIFILLGSERGFCAGFNDNIIHKLSEIQQNQVNEIQKLVVVGHKLAMKMTGDNRVTKIIDGCNSTEEIPTVIYQLAQSVEQISSDAEMKLHPGHWLIISNDENQNHIEVNTLQPFSEFTSEKNQDSSFPPIINEADNGFFSAFSEHYLFSLLYSRFYNSFFAENNQRLHHLDSALDRLDRQIKSLTHSLNLLRQEEITDEIEVIMLSAEEILKEIDITLTD